MACALRVAALLAVLATAGCTWRQTAPPFAPPSAPLLAPPPPQPEIATGWSPKPGWTAQRFMVAAAHPLAADAGHEILQAGGSALDAAIAVQAVLALVEPQSSGIGGGAFLMHWDDWDGAEVQAWDGRETAPAAAGERLLLAPDGQPLPFGEAVFGGRAVGTPGVLKMLEAAHRRHGRLPWARLFEPAISLADSGFPVGPRLHGQLLTDPHLRKDALARAFFYRADGSPHPVGHRLRNPALAAVLRAVATGGSEALYRGPVAADMVARVRGHAVPGTLSEADLVAYAPRLREPICTLWLEVYRVCGFPPPSSGHIAVMQILGILEMLPAPAPRLQDGIPGADWLHAYTEAARLAFADRAEYVADPDFVPAPGGDWKTLLAHAYLQQRAALIGPQSMNAARAGQPPGLAPVVRAPMPEQPEHGTSHISIVDGEGRAVAMTSTIEAQFGARVMADGGSGLPGGYLLNNQLTDFSFTPADAQGRPVANRLQPGKRPRSSMSPTLVFDARSGRLLMSLGSPGGPAIIHFTARTLLGTLAWGLEAQRAIEGPNFGNFKGPTVLEAGRFPAATVEALRARGHSVVESELTSGLQVIQRTPGGWHGGADPRREGVVRGD
ncbi:MAG TPA: gamma-glutamyltransferase family protein [Rubrivivax sp.]|nr:gamma-glutamyltransferase family protein [Rubrivivax sp.]